MLKFRSSLLMKHYVFSNLTKLRKLIKSCILRAVTVSKFIASWFFVESKKLKQLH